MWIEIRFRPNGGWPWFPDSFREFVAAKLDGAASPTLFWMGSSGRPLPGTPLVTFIGSKGWVGLRAIQTESESGRNAAMAALDASTAIARALDQSFGGQHAIEIKQGGYSVERAHPTKYHIRKLVIPRNRSRKRYEAFLGALPPRGSGEEREIQPEFLPMLSDLILSALKESLPNDAHCFLNGLKFVEPPKWGAPVTAGGELAFVARDLTFTLPYRVTGPVQAGGLRARGYGDIRMAFGGPLK